MLVLVCPNINFYTFWLYLFLQYSENPYPLFYKQLTSYLLLSSMTKLNMNNHLGPRSPTNSQLMYGSSTLSWSNLRNKLNYNHVLASTSSLDMVLNIKDTSVIIVLYISMSLKIYCSQVTIMCVLQVDQMYRVWYECGSISNI